MKKLLLSTVLALGWFATPVAPAMAQNNPCTVSGVPSVGTICALGRLNTYSAVSTGLVPASSATDVFCLNGSTSRNVHLRRVLVSGNAGTAINTPVIVKLNHSKDTGGTAATGAALPVPVPMSTLNPAATATTTAYTGNPTIPDSTPNRLTAFNVTFGATTDDNGASQALAGSAVDAFDQGWDIPKAATVVQQICINLNGVSVSTGALTLTAEWTED